MELVRNRQSSQGQPPKGRKSSGFGEGTGCIETVYLWVTKERLGLIYTHFKDPYLSFHKKKKSRFLFVKQ